MKLNNQKQRKWLILEMKSLLASQYELKTYCTKYLYKI